MPSVNDGLDCFGVAATGRVVNILTARGEIDLEKLKFAVYDFTSMYTKFTHKMIMTQMTKLLTYVYRRQAVVLEGDTAYLFVPHHQDYQRLASFWSKYPTLGEKDPRAKTHAVMRESDGRRVSLRLYELILQP